MNKIAIKAASFIIAFLITTLGIFYFVRSRSGDTSVNYFCQTEEILAVIGSDGNVYTYDLCEKRLTPLTTDGQPPDKNSGLEDGPYYFFDASEAWSSDHDMLLVGKQYTAYVIDLRDGSKAPLGNRAISASWAPTGKKVALVQIPQEQGSLYSNPLDYNLITVIDTRDFSMQINFNGNGPVWIDNSELVYFSVIEKLGGATQYILHDTMKINLEGQNETLSPKVKVGGGATIRYSRLAKDKKHLAIYANYGLNLGIVDLNSTETFSMSRVVHLGIPPTHYYSNAYRWSPAESVLAVCTPPGGSDAPSLMGNGAVLLLEYNRSPQAFNKKRCLPSSEISWNPSGSLLAFINNENKLSFVDILHGNLKGEPKQSLEIEAGPWWSPNGDLIGVIANDKICISPIDETVSSLDFECVVDGLEMTWRP